MTMTTDQLTRALHAWAAGIYAAEAGVNLLIANGTFIHRYDFTSRFIEHGTSSGTPVAAIDWGAAVTALNAGELPCSGGESFNSPPASQTVSPSACATPSPDSTTTTPPDSSWRYGTQPGVVIYDS
jgi:hypothetical protein